MAQKLPVKIRADIRDKFEAADCPLQTTANALSATLGYEVRFQIEWIILWTSLESYFPDKELFIPYVVTVVNSWAQRLHEKLEDEKNENWTEALLEELEKRKGVYVKFDILNVDRPTVTFDKRSTQFTIVFPKKTAVSPSIIASGLYEDFETLLEDKAPASVTLTTRSKEEGWDEVLPESSSAGGATAQSENPLATARPKITVLPTVDSLPRPEQLFRETVPYTLTMQSLNSNIIIRCTHQPSLELMEGYFSRYAKIDQQDVRHIPLIKVELRQSHFGMGVMYDSLHVEPFSDQRRNWVQINEALFISFIEGVLGYELVTTNGHAFVYKRDTPFKSGWNNRFS